VLVGAHASGDAVKYNADFHKVSNFKFQVSRKRDGLVGHHRRGRRMK
jgi:hypothetical protein